MKGYSSLPDTSDALSDIFCICCKYKNKANLSVGTHVLNFTLSGN